MHRSVTFDIGMGPDIWVYNCGWRLANWDHPYRVNFDGEDLLEQPIGLIDFYKQTGILPPKSGE